MVETKTVLWIVVLVLFIATVMLFIKNRSLDAQVEDAAILGSAVQEMMRIQHIRCSALPSQFGKIAETCIAPNLARKEFKEDGFRQPNDRLDERGYLVIKNIDGHVYQASDFRFEFNRVALQNGCTVPGEIGRDVTCRFEFEDDCEEGGILEVFYPLDGVDRLVFLKTC